MGLFLVSPVPSGQRILETVCDDPRLYGQLKVKVLGGKRGGTEKMCIDGNDLEECKNWRFAYSNVIIIESSTFTHEKT